MEIMTHTHCIPCSVYLILMVFLFPGDEERSVEAEQEGEKEMKMVLHCPPIYPLPEEIKKMERSETVCHYCGLSYLIFHEFHQLHSRLAQMEEELQELRETTQREKAQREALDLGRLEWERAFHLEVQRQTEKTTGEELQERDKAPESALREEFEQKNEKERLEMKEKYQKMSEEKERRLRRELGDVEAETLRKQRELERRTEEREKVLSDALQKANKNLEELRKCFQQLEEREQRSQSEEQLSQQKHSESGHREELLRLKGELEEKHQRWLSCQRRCDTVEEQLSSWQQREGQMSRKYCTAEEEVTRLREALEEVLQETRELRRERDMMIESQSRALNKMEEDCRRQMPSKLAAALEEQRAQNALHLREQMEELRREVELELTIDKEKNQLLLLLYQQDGTQLQQKLEEREQVLRGLQEELQEERTSREEEGRRREEEIHRELQHSQQQEALQLSQTKDEHQLVTKRNAELQQEVALLQETVRGECEERGQLTAALAQAHEELLGLRSLASHQGSSRSPLKPTERHTPPGNTHSQTRVPLTRSLNSPNTLRPSPACTDKAPGRGTDGAGAGRSFEFWNRGVERRREGTLPRLRVSSKVGEVKCKVSLEMGEKERL
ncbi:stress response protein nst1 isoform X4 [Cottoperca gobio]|uniref:Stress response protein nst1 isoform X4 n=1 Tax=Cottoperca gobio TaxID=56716 RepID=A0A6J2QZ56_COTGO|nr:leucine-, glutamate- and lysine-rich protein 1 isoform X4 [Cottoperca gobio]